MIRWAVAAALALALLQGLAAARIELTFDEAYYALWARWPQAGYLDHPPMVAWTIAASQALFGGGEFGVRALFWLEGACLPALAGWIGWRLYDARTGAAAALILTGAPLLAGAPLATPDTPLAFFWTLALAGLVEVWRSGMALRRDANGSTAGRHPRESGDPGGAHVVRPLGPRFRGDDGRLGWLLVGLAAGAAGLSKMTAGFLALGIALALVVTPSLRRQWRRPGLWVAAALGLAVVSPFLAWNAAHDFATFHKQGGRLSALRFAPRYLGEFLGAQLLLFNPLSAAAAIWAAWARSADRSEQSAGGEPTRLLLATVAPALAYFLLHSLHDRVQGNWTAPLFPALALLAARVAPRWLPGAAAASGLVVAAAAYLHLAFAWPAFGPGDPTLRLGGWRELAAQVFARRGDASYLLAQGYAATSLLAFYGPPGTPVAEFGEPERWGFRPPVDTSGDGLAFGPPEMAAALGRVYARVTPLATLPRRVGGVEMERYVLFAVGR